MIPGEILPQDGEIELNAGRATTTLDVANTGDRPIQVGSHYHFAETNAALRFDRAAARGMRLNIASSTAVRFEPGQQRTVELVALAGDRVVYGFTGAVMGALDPVRGTSRGAAAKAATRTPAATGPAVRKPVARKSAAKKPAPKRKPGSKR